MADKYILKVTAGPTYEEKDQRPVHVNSEQPIQINSPHLDASLTVRVQNFRGLPQGSPSTSPYFQSPPHQHDLYSLAFSFVPKQDSKGSDVVFGNDFDHPIRDKLPPGFDQAFKIVKWFIDPGSYGDVYADEPYSLGPLLSSINTFRIGAKGGDSEKQEEGVVIFEEGAEDGGIEQREKSGMPKDAGQRKKYFLTEAKLKDFTFEKGRKYSCDFFNPYLDFNDFALKLPGFSLIPGITLPIISYWDGQPLRSHSLRYVLKNRATNEPLFVAIFTSIPKNQADAADQQLKAQGDDSNAKAQTVKEAQNDADLD